MDYTPAAYSAGMPDPQREAARRRGHEIFDPIVEPLLAEPDVDVGRMFGSEGVRIRGKVFAFLGFDGTLMAKLPSARIDALVGAGVARRMVMKGRPLREWVEVDTDRGDAWPEIVRDAYAFLDEITP
ncbi:hypothetical protein QE377_001741 [Microbacterium sp. SORGH_AS 862]|nr:hypothetical protein [Microbacterium sp. SORGH_AS_0862]